MRLVGDQKVLRVYLWCTPRDHETRFIRLLLSHFSLGQSICPFVFKDPRDTHSSHSFTTAIQLQDAFPSHRFHGHLGCQRCRRRSSSRPRSRAKLDVSCTTLTLSQPHHNSLLKSPNHTAMLIPHPSRHSTDLLGNLPIYCLNDWQANNIVGSFMSILTNPNRQAANATAQGLIAPNTMRSPTASTRSRTSLWDLSHSRVKQTLSMASWVLRPSPE